MVHGVYVVLMFPLPPRIVGEATASLCKWFAMRATSLFGVAFKDSG